MKTTITTALFLLLHAFAARAQQARILSPNGKIGAALYKDEGAKAGSWYLKVLYLADGKETTAIPRIDLGLVRNDQDFSNNLLLLKVGKPQLINEQYTALHGKRLNRTNAANELMVSFETPGKAKMNLFIRAWNDGVTFRYEFPEKQGSFVIREESTTYSIPQTTMRWMERWNPANEGLYTAMSDDKVQQQDWCYPALFNTADKACWFLLHEADVDRGYCGTKLRNNDDRNAYKLVFPNPKDGNGQGDSLPSITLPWRSPWRVVVAGSLADIIHSTLVEDASAPSVIKNTDWIRPGAVSWNYWSSNHGTKDYKIVTAFADLAARMNWPYTLLDWEWDGMSNGGTVEDAVRYILSKGVKPLIWYNSGGKHTNVSSTPRDRMLTHENRVVEFTKLKKLGFVGVKVDFFESEKQDMIRYYLDILEDAAQFEMMVYFHGCMVPRGWARTYPNLMTNEAVRGAEWYNNGPEFTGTAPEHNTILPFTRNVVGAMDYTPVTFTNSQFPHLTSYGHELALSVVFESALQHFADRPEGYDGLPDAARAFLKTVPTVWDDTQLLDGYPGKEVILARRKGNDWYVGGINAEIRPKKKTLSFGFLKAGVQYKMTLIADGEHDKAFDIQQLVVNQSTSVDVKLLRRGGFAASLVPL
ncbi:glycoside hydrolase family 97 protein [Paraflavitalea soli]|uniref:Glycoside hydrolase family 97 protein n=1 Tax=Paraflavitalea soli TaxID=2315862 RepID=A0A3B7MKC0_9BACT|nr:glycoside hydrolase family 97 protein [Paraflavitalea soli]AXY74097.1 glycoside hydrolase family 97 protein [Paraflavitalea soli]